MSWYLKIILSIIGKKSSYTSQQIETLAARLLKLDGHFVEAINFHSAPDELEIKELPVDIALHLIDYIDRCIHSLTSPLTFTLTFVSSIIIAIKVVNDRPAYTIEFLEVISDESNKQYLRDLTHRNLLKKERLTPSQKLDLESLQKLELRQFATLGYNACLPPFKQLFTLLTEYGTKEDVLKLQEILNKSAFQIDPLRREF